MRLPARDVREPTDDSRDERIQQRHDRVSRALSSLPRQQGVIPAAALLQGVIIVGTPQTDGSITDGVTFTSSGSQELPHGLGRRAQGFLVVDAQTSAPDLRRVTVTTGLEETHIKLTHAGASNTVVRLLVW